MDKVMDAKVNYHHAVTEAWKVYEQDVAPARKVMDAIRDTSGPTDEDWKVFNEATLPARIKLETAIAPTRRLRDEALKVARRGN